MRWARLATIPAADGRRSSLEAGVALVLAAALGAFAACATHRLNEQQEQEDASRLARARALVREGHYAALKEALALVEDVHERAGDERPPADQLVETALLVAAREKELAIADSGVLALAERTLAACTDAAARQAALTIVQWEPLAHRGLAGFDTQGLRDDREAFRQRFEDLRTATDVIRARAGEEFFAYVLSGDPLPFARPTSPGVAEPPASPLLLYRRAAAAGDVGQLEQLLQRQPAFAEAHYVIGSRILDRTARAADLARAHQHLATALEALPASAAVRMAAADLRFALGDWDGGIEQYESTLMLAATHREALLRRAICLSLLSRPQDALTALDALAALPGGYLPGETHYWIAWNLRQLGRLAETQPHVARARTALSGDSRVHLLAGQIAYALDHVEQAAADFRRAVKLNERECEAHAGTAAIQATRREWPSASGSYERAAVCQAAAISELDDQLGELRAAALPPEALARMVSRRLAERERLALGRATNEFNAAAAAFNAGDLRRTVELADEASRHPLVAERARGLLEKVGLPVGR